MQEKRKLRLIYSWHSMDSFKKLRTGIIIYSSRGVDGACRINVLNKNEAYKMNVWWTKVKSSLSSSNIKTST